MCKHQLNRKNAKLGLMQQTLRVLSVQHARQAIFVLKNQLYQLFALVVLTVKHLRHLAYPVQLAISAFKALFNQHSATVVRIHLPGKAVVKCAKRVITVCQELPTRLNAQQVTIVPRVAVVLHRVKLGIFVQREAQ